jgi:predicted AAA+ superfamily ATPase
MAIKRYCEDYIYQDLHKKMVFVGGPRQVGKTTLSKQLCYEDFAEGVYFNWDVVEDRQAILARKWLTHAPLIIFDELHKYPRWKQWIKGIYDSKLPAQEYLVTGSARLDVYRRGGDSLMGRYHYWRLHPFTIDEVPAGISKEEAYHRLIQIGGFPEPFLNGDIREARRWRRERFVRILQEDIRDLDNIKNIQMLHLFLDSLRKRVGNLVTLSNIARDLEIAPKTAKSWLKVIEKMYIAFPIYPLTKNIPRSIRKPPKVYFLDNADVIDGESLRLENFVATTLLKRLHFIEDYYGYDCALHYIRDKDGREVDFAIIINGVLEYLIEVKLNNSDISTALKYYANKLKPKHAVQIVANLKLPYDKNNILVTNPIDFFTITSKAPWDNTKSKEQL